MIHATGVLDERIGGRPVSLVEPPFTPRRTLYGFIDRQNLDGLYRTFDFPNPDASSPRRFVTTVPSQALFLLNNPFVLEAAARLAGRVEAAASDEDARITAFFRTTLGRAPTDAERAAARRFLALDPGPPPTPAWQHGWGRFDESTQRLADFRPLPHWTGDAYRGGPQYPDPTLGHLALTAEGGHAGTDSAHAAVRRFTAPAAGRLALSGRLEHKASSGDGVRARVVSSRSGLLGEWTAHNGQAITTLESVAVEAGETLDLVVDCLGGDDSDSFAWAPRLRQVEPAAAGQTWDARADFEGPPPPPLTPWQRLAQVLLLSNEFAYVD
jgi:hypothetical protein